MNQKSTPQAFGIIGLGRFGMALAKALSESGREVIVLDRDEDKVKEVRAFTDYAYICEKLSKEAMQEAGIDGCDVVVVCIGEQLDTSILTALHVLALGVPKVFAKATSTEHGMILEKLGVEPLFPEQEAATWTARAILSRNLLDYIPIGADIEIAKIKIGEKFAGASVAGADFRRTFGLNIIALERESGFSIDVDSSDVFEANDAVVVIGKEAQICYLEHFLQQ